MNKASKCDKEKRIIPLCVQSCKNLATPPPANHHYQLPQTAPGYFIILNHWLSNNSFFLQNSLQHLPEGESKQICMPLLSPNPDIQDVKTISILCPNNPKKRISSAKGKGQSRAEHQALSCSPGLDFSPSRGVFQQDSGSSGGAAAAEQ